MKKKILIIVPTLGMGGGEKLALSIANYINRERFEVTVLSLYGKQNMYYDEFVKDNDINVVYLNKKPGADVGLVFKVAGVIRKLKPDVIHTHLYVVPYVILGSVFIKEKLHTVHSIAQNEATGALKKFMNFAYKYAGFVPVAICDHVKKTICEYYKIEGSRVPCIYNGIDTEVFSEKQDFADNDITFIMTASFQRLKNHRMLINAFYKLSLEHENLKLKLIGDGVLRDEIEAQIKEYNLDDKIELLGGNVSNVNDYLRESDIYVCTSNIEGLPLSVLEAMSCGLPVISTKAGGIVDIVENDENGILIDIGDEEALYNAMEKLITDNELRRKMGKRSYELSSKYDIRKCVKEYEELYSEV